jgi:tetratricopeptide (TPR) repeat protein
VLIIAICGMPGVGKTSLAVHWVHRVRTRFPDGQLYINLRGFDPSDAATSPAEAVNRLLYALGVPAQRMSVPVEAQLDLFRSELAGRRIALVLDNARDAEQVRALLPGDPGCLVVVTSRDDLRGLVAAQGARQIGLDPLTDDEARQVLTRRLGQERIAAEPAAVSEVITHCGHLPLALAVTAARAASRPGLSLAAVAGELTDARGGLGAFDGSDPATDLRAVFSWSYRLLSDSAAALFRLLALHPGPEISTAAAASLAGIAVPQARILLAELAGANLAAEHSVDRYTWHDLVRAYATEQLMAHVDEAARQCALFRMFDHYLHTAHSAAVLLDPHRQQITVGPATPGVAPEPLAHLADALRWFGVEHLVLLAVIDRAWTAGADARVEPLAWSLTDFLQRQGHWHDQASVQRVAVAATRRLGDRPGQARARRLLGLAYAWLGRYGEARTEYLAALELFTDLADQVGQANTHRGLAWLWEQQHCAGNALEHAQQALALFRAVDDRAAEGRTLNMVGWYHLELGDANRGLVCCTEALRLLTQLGDAYGKASAWDSLGYAHHRLGHHQRATVCYQHALDLLGELGDRCEEANALVRLGDAYEAGSNRVEARRAWRDALAILADLEHPMTDEVRTKLSRTATVLP